MEDVISRLRDEFDTIYYSQPPSDDSVGADEIRGGVIKMVDEDLMKKLDLAVEAKMDFVAIDGVEYIFDNQKSLEKFVESARQKWSK